MRSPSASDPKLSGAQPTWVVGPPLSPDSRIDSLIEGEYQVTKILRQGELGPTYLTYNPRLKRHFAVLMLNRELAPTNEMMLEVRRDLKRAQTLTGIMPMRQVHDQAGIPGFATEILDGETLRQRLFRGPLPVERGLGLVLSLCRTLEAAHQAGLIHGDLRPENVFLVRPEAKSPHAGKALLQDHSLRHLRRRPKGLDDTLPIHKLMYRPPEQVAGEMEGADVGGDVFTLGAILYECLTRQPAFGGADVEAVLEKLSGSPELMKPSPATGLVPGLCEALNVVVAGACTRTQDARIPTMAAFERVLLQVASGAGLQLPTPVVEPAEHVVPAQQRGRMSRIFERLSGVFPQVQVFTGAPRKTDGSLPGVAVIAPPKGLLLVEPAKQLPALEPAKQAAEAAKAVPEPAKQEPEASKPASDPVMHAPEPVKQAAEEAKPAEAMKQAPEPGIHALDAASRGPDAMSHGPDAVSHAPDTVNQGPEGTARPSEPLPPQPETASSPGEPASRPSEPLIDVLGPTNPALPPAPPPVPAPPPGVVIEERPPSGSRPELRHRRSPMIMPRIEVPGAPPPPPRSGNRPAEPPPAPIGSVPVSAAVTSPEAHNLETQPPRQRTPVRFDREVHSAAVLDREARSAAVIDGPPSPPPDDARPTMLLAQLPKSAPGVLPSRPAQPAGALPGVAMPLSGPPPRPTKSSIPPAPRPTRPTRARDITQLVAAVQAGRMAPDQAVQLARVPEELPLVEGDLYGSLGGMELPQPLQVTRSLPRPQSGLLRFLLQHQELTAAMVGGALILVLGIVLMWCHG